MTIDKLKLRDSILSIKIRALLTTSPSFFSKQQLFNTFRVLNTSFKWYRKGELLKIQLSQRVADCDLSDRGTLSTTTKFSE